jgi:serine/threonine protein kinase
MNLPGKDALSTEGSPALGPPFPAGQELAPGYRVDEHLARGEVLDAYAVWSEERSCLCVAKTLRPDRTADIVARGQLLAEGRLAQRLAHPHLVRGYDTVTRPRPTAILETLAGETLGHLVARRRTALPACDIVELGYQLTSAVGYLHRNGVLHLDLKPSNVVVEAGRARLLDLSHARPPGRCPAGFGTVEYMAPEQLTGGIVSEATDVYGLGGVLYRSATGRRPFGANGRVHHPDRRPPFARLHRRALPRALVGVIESCFEPEPYERLTIPDVVAALTSER